MEEGIQLRYEGQLCSWRKVYCYSWRVIHSNSGYTLTSYLLYTVPIALDIQGDTISLPSSFPLYESHRQFLE